MSSTEQSWRRVLAIDTATRTQSLALMDGETVLEHSQRKVKFNHGSTLLSHLNQTLAEHKLEVGDLDLIAVGVGPGSFTGLRVGLAIAKSLARAEDIPIVGVSTLAALAYPVAIGHQFAAVCPMYDARRQEVYAGLYAYDESHLTQLEPDRTASPAAMRQKILELASSSRPVIIVGDGPRKYDELADWDMPDVNWETPDVTLMPAWADGPSAVGLAQIGRQKAQHGHLADVASLEPNYIRPTDAELNYKG
ncbi:tRNA (adenosine(37)-N6)-threonylcarbamoyltransferase complex dimerization subunit type 1 TsaB [Persicimonas caeni]|nr:tRNA (adenosine(37)-N6)-threonylcarbamoyltransferase complex dimerization subunit type 1 TsaB [Persicimonas caeni]